MQVYEEKTHNIKLQTKTNKVYVDHTKIQAKNKHVDYTDLHEGKNGIPMDRWFCLVNMAIRRNIQIDPENRAIRKG